MSKQGNPIFVGGVPRSGTTLLRVILDTHPRIFCGTELRVVQALANLWASAEQHSGELLQLAYGTTRETVRQAFAELVTSFLAPAWRASGKPRVAEKTPSNVLVFPALRILFPQSPLIHVIRDARDVVASRLERDKATASFPIDAAALARERAREWTSTMRLRRRFLADASAREGYFEIRYEDLVRAPEAALKPLFEFIGEDFDPSVLEFHRVQRNTAGSEEWSSEAVSRSIFASSIGRWKAALSARERDAVLMEAHEQLSELGYELTELQ
ncbi:MAG TPA: sulfotransferase [Steroidobacter sp.]|nr:sulfotransferase [Steroidobacter sp.]